MIYAYIGLMNVANFILIVILLLEENIKSIGNCSKMLLAVASKLFCWLVEFLDEDLSNLGMM